MTVTGVFGYNIRPYTGYSDQGLPIGSYIAQGGLVGDASGGTLVFNFEFMPEQDELVTEIFNLEALSLDTNSATGEDVVMTTVNMDQLSRNRPVSAKTYKWDVTPCVGLAVGSINQVFSDNLPIWLGSPNLSARAGSGNLRFRWVNTDLRLYAVTIEGYIWGPRSILADGGPRRPIGGGLFRS